MNAEDIILHTLRTLVQAEGHPLPQDVLIAQVECRVKPRPKSGEVLDSIKVMEQRGLIAQRPYDLDLTGNNPCWLLDEKGQAMATRMRL